MTSAKIGKGIHPQELELAEYLACETAQPEAKSISAHLASCDECLGKIVSAYDAVTEFGKDKHQDKKGRKNMKNIPIYLILAVICFSLSFAIPRYFIQLLVATLLLGIKWIVDAKSTKMLVMVYEAWKKDGDKGASRVLETMDAVNKKRF